MYIGLKCLPQNVCNLTNSAKLNFINILEGQLTLQAKLHVI